MKKLFYVFVIAAFTSLTITGCTEEEVKPQTGTDNGGGSASDPKGS
jgi:hypothetical protein